MIRKVALVTVALSLIVGVANAASIQGTGQVTCGITGSAKIKPGLVFGGTSPITIKFKGKMEPCTGSGGNGGDIVKGKIKGLGTNNTNDCGALGASGVPPIAATAKWKTSRGTPKLLASNINITGGTITVSGSISTHLTGNVSGGSFQGNALSADAVLDETIEEFATACGTPRGVTAFHFTGVNGPSSLSLNP